MNVPNHERKAFRDMTPEEWSGIVEAWLFDNIEYYSNDLDGWQEKGSSGLYGSTVYRTIPRQLVIPWEHIKEEYKWAAMGRNGGVCFYPRKPTCVEIVGQWGGGGYSCNSPLNIDTTGIDRRESRTQRPEGV